ncbi:hypothetical protein NQ317_002179 [Molorchus minor]|uniref:Uncharacterized protein n=1 Tax=Molorchus minor TaxID=1323400 RepID=A0ABQ9IWS1_9CUCU|nr:hypothetical protein NQ317_002179 [Molorchus minor]
MFFHMKFFGGIKRHLVMEWHLRRSHFLLFCKKLSIKECQVLSTKQQQPRRTHTAHLIRKKHFITGKFSKKSYPNLASSFLPHYWMPRWVEGITDPSARFIKHYAAEQK